MHHQHEPADIIRDLLTIAKVAMPEELYEIDPRVTKALDYLEGHMPSTSTKVLGVPTVSAIGRKRHLKPSE